MYFNISITIIIPNLSSFHHFYLNFHLFHHFSPFYLSYFSHLSHPNYFLDYTSYIFPFSHLTKPYTIITFLILIVLFITFQSTSSLLNLLARPIRLIHPSLHPFIHHKVLIHLIRLILSFWSILSIRSTRPSSRLYFIINLKILILLIRPTPLNLLIILTDHILPIRPTSNQPSYSSNRSHSSYPSHSTLPFYSSNRSDPSYPSHSNSTFLFF